jgi:hypothetical protein
MPNYLQLSCYPVSHALAMKMHPFSAPRLLGLGAELFFNFLGISHASQLRYETTQVLT